MAPYMIPNAGDAGIDITQAQVDNVDVDILVSGFERTGVVSGCAVTPGTGMQVTTAAGVVQLRGKKITVAGGNTAVTAAHATLKRVDLVSSNSSGTIVVTAGTAAANPLTPEVPANSVALAVVYVAPTVTSFVAANITDRRIVLRAERDIVYVADYASDGVTVTATEAQAAHNAVGLNGTVIYPSGTHSFGATAVNVDGNHRIIGSGQGKTIIQFSGAQAFIINLSGVAAVEGYMGHMTIDGNGTGDTGVRFGTQVGIGYTGYLVECVTFKGCNIAGAASPNGRWLTFLKCSFSDNKAAGGDGFRFTSTNTAYYAKHVAFYSCQFNTNVHGLYAMHGENVLLHCCSFIDNSEEGTFLERTAGGYTFRRWSFNDCYWMNNNMSRIADARGGVQGWGQHRQVVTTGTGGIQDVEIRNARFEDDLATASLNWHVVVGDSTGAGPTYLAGGNLRLWEPSAISSFRVNVSSNASSIMGMWDNAQPNLSHTTVGALANVTYFWSEADQWAIWTNDAGTLSRCFTVSPGKKLGFYGPLSFVGVTKPDVTGSYNTESAELVLSRLITALASTGLITNSVTGTPT